MTFDHKTEDIISHRKDNSIIPDFTSETMPTDVGEAYEIQKKVIESFGLNQLGWKVGCTTKMAQEFSGMSEPFSGAMFSETTFSSPELELSVYMNKPIIEPELCFEISEDLTDKNTPYDEKNIVNYIKSICPVIEIVDARYEKGWDIKALETISDNGVHSCLIMGNKLADWQEYDRLDSEMRLYVEGEFISGGKGRNVLGDPLRSVAWIANSLLKRDQHIKAGEIITTGNTCDKPIFAEKNKTILAYFNGLGEVVIKLV